MRYFKGHIFIVCLVIIILLIGLNEIRQLNKSSIPVANLETSTEHVDSQPELKQKETPSKKEKLTGINSFIGLTSKEVIQKFGEPTRIDPSAYDYEWWVYKNDLSSYVQFGVENDKVVTIYVVGENINVFPFKIGESVEGILEKHSITPSIEVKLTDSTYRFNLTPQDMLTKPVVKVDNNVYAQIYIDTITESVLSIRYMNQETLVKLKPYELVYRGTLRTAQDVSAAKWREIEKGSALQIFDVTNVLRSRYGLPPVLWDEKTAEVAYMHSKDMNEYNYFSHTSPTAGGLSDRLKKNDIFFKMAGENIAAKYVDGLAAVAGWVNSAGHRETMFNGEFSHLGVGVYERYFTQNFIEEWS
ncbi:hypothetical protein EJF36_08525 [Bacillus sp. HMF5848]|uniref:CAP domain-containing protein n=1 Tax=Bacillus sp. HMF5848 TaxID=2495421 RepID=UPI000F767E35|nr:CAP domain-containing protein [Bacillus sp. HMF5848]RSK26909.1 hypothetical protein EJF36_08525 [Bacillus sp. HMF5848]